MKNLCKNENRKKFRKCGPRCLAIRRRISDSYGPMWLGKELYLLLCFVMVIVKQACSLALWFTMAFIQPVAVHVEIADGGVIMASLICEPQASHRSIYFIYFIYVKLSVHIM